MDKRETWRAETWDVFVVGSGKHVCRASQYDAASIARDHNAVGAMREALETIASGMCRSDGVANCRCHPCIARAALTQAGEE